LGFLVGGCTFQTNPILAFGAELEIRSEASSKGYLSMGCAQVWKSQGIQRTAFIPLFFCAWRDGSCFTGEAKTYESMTQMMRIRNFSSNLEIGSR
jgi:hypothetical protein